MANTTNRVLTSISSWSRKLPSRYGSLALALCILGLGLLAVLLVQPSPLTFVEGWSEPRSIDAVQFGDPHRAAVDRQNQIHLAWQKQVGRKAVAFYAHLDRHGQALDEPIRLSDPDANAENVALALTRDDAPLCFWIEKGGADTSQRLMMAKPGSEEARQIVSTSSRIMRDLAVASDREGRVYLVWSDNRLGLYDIYMAALDGGGNLSFTDQRITDTGKAFVFEPALAPGGGIAHLAYFSDEVTNVNLVHRVYDAAGRSLTEPQVLEQMSQVAISLGGGSQRSYPVLAVAKAEGGLRLYESLGSMVRWREMDGQGQEVQPPAPLLLGSQYYSQVSLARREAHQWLIWSDLRWGSGDRFQVYVAPLDETGRVAKEIRLTFATSSALWPVMVIDGEDGQHVIWQQTTGPYTYQLMYANNLDPARISAWQRLGFSGVGGGWSFLLALAQSAILAVITVFPNLWRPAIAWAVTALVLQIARRIEAVRPHAHLAAWVALLATLFLVVRPETKTLGQMPIAVAAGAHWVMGAAASALVLYLGRIWRDRFYSLLIWAGLASLWSLVYYFLNLTLILREGFAV
ncbi:MAG: hypothetical protein JSV36_06235 [Anaerolineae bacterium]|nr:MAG: hypothetical protein JSV36_06235 [Anaerolineae bacterium]